MTPIVLAGLNNLTLIKVQELFSNFSIESSLLTFSPPTIQVALKQATAVAKYLGWLRLFISVQLCPL